MTGGNIEALVAVLQSQTAALTKLATAIESNTEATALLVHAVAALLGEETGIQVDQAEQQPGPLSTLDDE